MTKEPVCIRENDLMTHARHVLRDKHLHSLPVLDSGGRVTGILDDHDILRLQSNTSDVTVNGYAHEFPLITPDMDVKDAAKELLNAKQHRAPVLNSSTDKTIAGIISDKDILHHAHLMKMHLRNVSQIMNTKVMTAYNDDPVSKVWGNMLEHNYSGIPVISYNDEVLGIVTRSNLIKAGFIRTGNRSADTHDSLSGDSPKVERVMSTPLYSISSTTPVSKAIKSLVDHNIGRICVTEDSRLVGMVDRFSLLKECLESPCLE
ncbi:CBS domain-containing protein [Methanolobus sp. WCC4]|uniref:CBS domain-containing protein n=1 Tax=Methanolobus sp. WCC4 TaxID=3125784 RepID=UPI0030F52AF2